MSGHALTPNCPGCDQPPAMIFDNGRQAFCGSEDCAVLIWNPYLSLTELAADIHQVKSEGPS